ncbi:hypothetical protein QE152_g34424 [Popillia japonica]|uniref:Uncharacterized protein n=1 Tax=Popillia japonica TaxID=7064 RepID=A0AAW1ITS0_POPJA
MDETKCLTPANSLTSLEKAKLCNTLMHKIKSTESRKIIFRNPAEPTDYDKSVSAVYPDTIINLEDKFRNNRQYEEELSNENGQEYATYFELDVNKLTSNLQFVEHKVEDDFADISSVDGNTIKNYIEEDLSDDEVSIIRAKEAAVSVVLVATERGRPRGSRGQAYVQREEDRRESAQSGATKHTLVVSVR